MIERLMVVLAAAVRSFATARLPAAAAVLTLATAVGVNLAMAGLIDRAFLSPPAHIVDPASVVTLGFHPPDGDGSAVMTTASYVTFTAIDREVPAFSQAAAWQRLADRVIVEGEQQPAEVMLVSGSYFALLGSPAAVGRAIGPDDEAQGATAPIAVISDAFWASALNRDRSIVGRRLNVRGQDFEIAGVMPEGFSGHSAARVDLWLPFTAAMRDTPGWDRD